MLARGVSDVGLRSFIVLLQGTRRQERFALQVKEARQSVLHPYVLPEFRHRGNQARRIAMGQALIQSQPDPLLGYSRWQDRDYCEPVAAGGQRLPADESTEPAAVRPPVGFTLARSPRRDRRSDRHRCVPRGLGLVRQGCVTLCGPLRGGGEADYTQFAKFVADEQVQIPPDD